MGALLRQLMDICLLRRGPQDLRYSPMAVAVLVSGLVALQLAFAASQGLPLQALAARVLVTVFLLLGVTAWLLRWRGHENRVVQTQTALAGTGLLFDLAMMPVALALLQHLGDEQPPVGVLVYALAAIVLFFWQLRVDAAIWLQALELRVGQAYALAVAMVLVEFLLLVLLAPAVPATPAS